MRCPLPHRLACSLGTLLLGSCVMVGVDYVPPDSWTASLTADVEERSARLEKWWRRFDDAELNELIERTREANPDLRIASQRIAEARALRGMAQSQLFPFANATGEITRSRTSDTTVFAFPLPENPSNLFKAGFDAGWEIDVFGGIRRNIEAADATTQASVEAYRDLLVTLFAETAMNYIEYRTLEERIRIAESNIAAQEESLNLTQSRLDAGLAPRIDATQAATNLETSRSLIPALRTQLALARNRIAALTGEYPDAIDPLLSRSGDIPFADIDSFSSLPADLIRARADVRQAERELAAQTARIGVAEADLFPRFTLFGSFALESEDSADFFDAKSRSYSFGPAFSWQIFSAGRIRKAIRAEEARTEQALSRYEKAVLSAVEEVESGMAAAANERDRLEILERAVAYSGETVELVKDNYQNGLIDFQRVLDAERTKFSTEDEAAVSRGEIAKNLVVLYKALGGGTEVEVVTISQPRTRAWRGFFQWRSHAPQPEAAGESATPVLE